MIAIKEMQMPDNCYECPFMMEHQTTGSDYCCITGYRIFSNDKREENCPLMEMEEKNER